ncbi:TerS protein [Kushneria phosphatilytica]|uniref:TerS protein n=1 Tax=Kushneria phosphatilytica TaxID=657387 RepID=A0A1S1NXD4_9GAMM|nr:TerS protein [Kushneria phosphatilytica]OHV12128.1 TerS protein [Kushneria phosphatilytica]QEL11323.1 TerS protein [Kushneria phosphatilytica]
MARRKRSDGAEYAAEAMDAAQSDLEPPAHVKLRDVDWPFWYDITRARARGSWTGVDLAHAANLARCQADIERLSTEIAEEGDIVVNAKGTQIVNPKHSLLETLSRRAVALAKTIQVHAHATQGPSEDQTKKNSKQRQSQQSIESTEDDGLIPRPMH